MSKYSVRLDQGRFTAKEIKLIEAAEQTAVLAHEGQTRKSGEPYIIHPAAVAQALADWGMDAVSIAAGWLHDTIEDTDLTEEWLKKEFGAEVAGLVAGVTKLSKVDKSTPPSDSARKEASNENVRKLLLAMTRDLRVIIVKLADRRHNLLTLKHLDPEKQRRIAAESLEIYTPIADRLGMGQLKAELEDLCFRYVDPPEYHRVERLMQGYVKQSHRYLAKLKRFIEKQLEVAGVEVVSIEGRQKHLYSVYRKLFKTEGDIDKIYDLMAVRIIVPEVSDCYKALGVLHQNFKPLIYRIKDYIAVPKPNGYRSLHTTVFALEGRITEIQIRTPIMHAEAERGLAAHFYYDAQKASKQYARRRVRRLPAKLNWVNSLADLHQSAASGQDFVESVKVDLFQDRIFVFSPKGDLYDLPEGSTAIDFAFAVHSSIGLRTQGAKVNGRIVPLGTALANRDVVEILTRKSPAPSRDWLTAVRTPYARSRIRAWFRKVDRESNVVSGRGAVEQEIRAWGVRHLEEVGSEKLNSLASDLNYKDLESVWAAVGEGAVSVGQVTRRLFPLANSAPHAKVARQAGTGKVEIAEKPGLNYHFAACCQPTFPQPLIGYITRGSGVTVHSKGCHNVPPEPERWVGCKWELSGQTDERLVVPLEVLALNKIGLLRDITGTVSAAGINISGLSSAPLDEEQVRVKMKVEVTDLHQLSGLMKRLESLAEVAGVRRAD
jgi:GTP diphosphokinase / guanosine-3',5'-bis(diphosphate) 3'-diphosphatase